MRSFVIVGVSHRSIRLCTEMPADIAASWRVAGLWDVDPRRFDAYDLVFPGAAAPRYLGTESFERMLEETRPDLALIGTMDCHHAAYVIACLRRGIEVVVEKPMVTDCEQARAVLAAEAASTASVHVAFNYRYMSANRTIKDVLDQRRIGRVTAVEIAIYLDEIHGSSYFQRWNRLRANSGGLTIHKEGHYIDLVGWWLGKRPVEVFCYGALNYYGPDAEANPSRVDGRHCSTCTESAACAYAQVRARKDAADGHITGLQGIDLRQRHRNGHLYTGYSPDQCIFDSEIDIEDTYSAVIRYDGGTFVTFSVNFSSPVETHRVTFSGTRGRLEHGYPFGAGDLYHGEAPLVHYPLFTRTPERLAIPPARPGGHGGADPALMEDLFSDAGDRSCRASALDGAYAVAVGEAMWRSARSGRPVAIADLLGARAIHDVGRATSRDVSGRVAVM